MEYGIVYLLTNPVMPGLVKIGMTTQEGIDKRMKELYTTGVPIPFECKFACKVKKSDCLKIEKALHKAFDPQRINQNREFFRINVEQAQAILELFHHEDVTEEVADEIQNDNKLKTPLWMVIWFDFTTHLLCRGKQIRFGDLEKDHCFLSLNPSAFSFYHRTFRIGSSS